MMPFKQNSKDWWATRKQKKRNKGKKRPKWWARKQGWSSPPGDTGSSSSSEGKGPTIIETPGLQTFFLCQTEAQAMQNMSPTCF